MPPPPPGKNPADVFGGVPKTEVPSAPRSVEKYSQCRTFEKPSFGLRSFDVSREDPARALASCSYDTRDVALARRRFALVGTAGSGFRTERAWSTLGGKEVVVALIGVPDSRRIVAASVAKLSQPLQHHGEYGDKRAV